MKSIKSKADPNGKNIILNTIILILYCIGLQITNYPEENIL